MTANYGQRKHPLTTQLRWLVLISLLFGLSSHSLAAKLYKWVDENGQIRYSDRLPAQQSKSRFQTLAPDGRVLQTKEATRPADEVRKEREELERLQREAEEKAREEKRLKAEKDHHDNVLLMTFSNESEIVDAKNERVAVIDSVIQLLKKNIDGEQEKLEELRGNAKKKFLDRGEKIPGGMAQQIEYSSEKLIAKQKQMQLKLEERDRIKQQYAEDLARYRVLTQQKSKP